MLPFKYLYYILQVVVYFQFYGVEKMFVIYHVSIIFRHLLRKYPEGDGQLLTEVNKLY